jgi:hypothetical protein
MIHPPQQRTFALIAALLLATCPRASGTDMESLLQTDWIQEDERFQLLKPIPQPVTTEVTTRLDAAGGCDGIKTGRFGFHTASGETDPWWQVDLGKPTALDRILIFNRTDCPPQRTAGIQVLVGLDPETPKFETVYQHNGRAFFGVKENQPLVVAFDKQNVTARIVRLQIPGRSSFALDEVEVYGRDDPKTNIALNRPADQKSLSPYSVAGTKGYEYKPPEVPEPKHVEFSLAHTRAVIDRGRQLAARFTGSGAPDRLMPLVEQLEEVARGADQLEAAGESSVADRRTQYFQARRILRRIAFCNPLLDFDRILFVKRHDPGGLYHMVHQYYGFGAVPGGGLFVLSNPFSDEPSVGNLLESATVENGRLAGLPLTPGTFLSPDLSFDGEKILFAYTQAEGEKPEWSPRASYHIFEVRSDGTGLTQLTDGPWDDFDPCYLPGGRIALISTRRGGYLRCGGSAPPWDSPTYTLYSMAGDGSDILCLSFHETQEWHPSVDNNGMLIYTRWDYVDRDTNVAHHIWNCYPDGRDPRSFHGNYPTERENRPWMEMSPRAIPGSNKYVATAAAHHGHAFGSLVSIDYRIEDDGAMSQVERLTPDVPLPESEGGKPMIRQYMSYGTPWPLSEDDYLCVYHPGGKNRGIYWIDRYGNRELLYRDPEISCLSPIPLRSRPAPPALPQRTTQAAAGTAEQDPTPATIAVMNVYDADFQWPADTRIEALRIIQVLPKTTPPADQPRIGVATETNARAVLGTVPVEPDGSAYFEAPVGKLIYFQALDHRGMAVQSMRSATYVHPGERLTCQGCHERKHSPPGPLERMPLALTREPSRITPAPDGANPFSYPRLVQPVLDRHCAECHRQKEAFDLSGTATGTFGWSKSYENLAGKYGFYFHVSNGSIKSGVHGGSRTIPGQFGAQASKLLDYLDDRHYGVNLPPEDFGRITLWLDSNSEFYGGYHDTTQQALGRIVHPALD